MIIPEIDLIVDLIFDLIFDLIYLILFNFTFNFHIGTTPLSRSPRWSTSSRVAKRSEICDRLARHEIQRGDDRRADRL